MIGEEFAQRGVIGVRVEIPSSARDRIAARAAAAGIPFADAAGQLLTIGLGYVEAAEAAGEDWRAIIGAPATWGGLP